MNKLKRKKYISLFGIVMLVFIITGIFVVNKYDKFKGLINVKDANIKLLSDVSVPTNIKGTDEVSYEVKYTLDTIENVTKRDVIIKGELNSEYARFKSLNNKHITSTISNDGKEIELIIKDVPLGEEQSINLKINVVNAPNNEEIKPTISIKEATGDYKKITTDSLVVHTNSVEGACYDENGIKVSNVELSLYKNGDEVKRTYSNSDGKFVFSDLEEGNYSVKVEEDNYELANDSSTNENNESLLLSLKQVDKFNIETYKYVSNLKLKIDNKEYNYSYEEAEKVVQSIKSFNNISGEIEYKIVVKNNSDKSTKVREVVDEIQYGLSFNKTKNPGWEIKENKVKYLPIEDVILEPYEKREYKIKLDILNTKELKTYINKVSIKGELNEKVIFILDNKEIRNIDVLEGHKVEKPNLGESIIWYTDKNKTNEYNFDNPVTKDLILYGSLEEKEIPDEDIIKVKVTYLDGEDKFYEEEVDYNTKAKGINNVPTKPHNIFLGWYLNDELFNFDTSITEDITLVSKYEEVEEPTISYSPLEWTNTSVTINISSNHSDYTYMYKIGDGDYTLYNGPFTLDHNASVYAYSVNNNIASTETRATINNIDKINPIIDELNFDSITPSSANMNLKISDGESGLDKYKVYVDNQLVYESLSYESDLNEEKYENYYISGLDELNTYVVKLEVFDIAGNVSELELTLDTPARHYVARTLYQSYETNRFESLEDAISSSDCSNDCHIEMLDNVTENNTITSNQNIVLDLNGKVIDGNNNYAFNNKGTLKILDNNEDETGRVHSNNIAILNENVLQIGENEEELIVSDTKPLIEGSSIGIKTTGTLNYYDGHIIGDTPIDGLVTNTPYLHNTKIVGSGNSSMSTLLRVTDAVAVINSVYYTDTQMAVDSSDNGYLDEVDYTRPLIEQLRTDGQYGFVYDSYTHSAVNDNRWIQNTIAHSYIKLDLTNYSDSQMLNINAEINSYNSSDVGYITITESEDIPSYDSTNGRLVYIYGNVAAKDYKTILQKGKVYYLHFGYRKSSNNKALPDTFRINDISLGNFDQVEFSNISEVVMYNDSNYYFAQDENGHYVSNNNGIASSSAHSYFIVDLTNVDEDKYIAVNASISSQASNDVGYIAVNNNKNMPNTNSNGIIRMSGEVTSKDYLVKLNKNQINFVHFYYSKDNRTNSGEDKFIINSLTPVSYELSALSDGQMVSNGEYYFEKQEDGSYKSNNKNVNNSTANSYMIFDLTNKPEMTLFVNVTISSELNKDYGYITLSNSTNAPTYDNTEGRFYISSGATTTSTLKINLIANSINYVHFGYYKNNNAHRNNDCFIINKIDLVDYSKNTIMNSSNFLTTITSDFSSSEEIPVLNQEPETVKLVKNVTLTKPLEIVNTRDVIFDLNGKTLTTSSNDYVIDNYGSLTIIDSNTQGKVYSTTNDVINNNRGAYLNVNSGSVILDSSNFNGIINNGSLTIGTDGQVKALRSSSIGILNAQAGDILEGSGTISTSETSSYGIFNKSVNDKSIKGYKLVTSNKNSYGFYNQGYNDLTLDSINSSGNGIDIYQDTNKNLTINNSILSSASNNSFDSKTSGVGTITINNSTIENKINNTSGSNRKIIINNSNLYASDRNNSISNYSGEVLLKNTNIFHNADYITSSTDIYAIYNNGSITIDGGTINKNKSTISTYYGLYNSSSGEATVKGDLEILGGYTYGIYNKNNLIIGNSGDSVSSNYPIIGGIISVYSPLGTSFSFYDGKLVGNKDVLLDGIVTDTPSYYDLYSTINGNSETITLKSYGDLLENNDYAASIGVNKYVSLQDAIDSINNTDKTEITLLRNICTAKNNIISDNKNIVLNQNGYLIKSYNSNQGFTNNGKFKITDNSNNSTYNNTAFGMLVLNNGEFIYDKVKTYAYPSIDILSNSEGSTMTIDGGELSSAKTRIISNSGDLIINDGYLYAAKSNDSHDDYLINNNSTGSITLNGGKIEFSGRNAVINNSGSVYAINPTVDLYGYYIPYRGTFATNFIDNNSPESYVKITGGTYGQDNRIGRLVKNKGTALLENVNSSFVVIASNENILNLTGGIYNITNYKDTIAIDSTAGNLTIDGSSINCINSPFNGINVSGTTEATLKNSTLTNAWITQDSTSTFDLINNTINSGDSSSLNISGSATTNLISGSIEATKNNGINVSGNAELNIGTQGGNVSTENPSITGKTYGLRNSSSTSTVNFYDGVISGETAINGGISNVEDGYEIILNTENNIEHKYLDVLPVIRNKRTGTEYNSIQEAINYASNNDTLELLREYTTTPSTNTIINDKNLTIDLKEYKLYQNNDKLFINNGTLTLTANESTGSIISNVGVIIDNNGILNIEEGIYRNTSTNYILLNNGGATLNINGGEIKSYDTRLINNVGTLNINSGKIYSTRTGESLVDEILINNSETGNIIINSGTFEFIGKGSLIQNEGRVEAVNPTVDLYGYNGVNGSTYRATIFINNTSSSSYAKITGGTYGSSQKSGMLVKNSGTAILENVDSDFETISDNTGSLTITGGTYNTSSKSRNLSGAITSTEGTVALTGVEMNEKSSNPNLYISGSTSATLTNCTLNNIINTSSASPSNAYFYNIAQEGSSDLVLNGCTLTANGDAVRIGGSGETSIVSGTIQSIYNLGVFIFGSGTLNIGTQGGEVSTENPKIIGSTYGLYNSTSNATVNFYDGVISGKPAIYGVISNVEDGYGIISSTQNDIQSKYLDIFPIVKNKRTGTEYESIQEAINYANSGDTLELIREYTTGSSLTSIVIPQNKEIIFDLKENKLYQNNDKLFINNGTLTLTTNESTGSIISNSGVIVDNNGILNIEEGKYRTTNTSYILSNNEGATLNVNGGEIKSYETRLINNAGTLNINSGKIYTTRTDSYLSIDEILINNTETGNIIINSGSFEFVGKGSLIQNEGRVEAKNPTVELYGYKTGWGSSSAATTFINNTSSSSYAKITGGTYGSSQKAGILVENSGIAVLENVNSDFDVISENTGTLTITGGTYNASSNTRNLSGAITSSSGIVTLNGVEINESSSNSPVYISGSSDLDIINGFESNSINPFIKLNGTGTTNIISGTIKSLNTYPILVNGNGTLNIGTIGGIPSTTDPAIEGSTYGIYNNNLNSKIYFYDGSISGGTSSINGAITDYEPGYKEDRSTITDSVTGNNIVKSTLTLIGNDVRTISVGNVNFISFQSAIDYAVNNSFSRIDLYSDIELSGTISKPEGINADVYLNGYKLLGDYTLGDGINIIDDGSSNNLGASIFNNKSTTKNIVIYQMDDGSDLDITNTYKLYKYNGTDFTIVKLNENSIGNYDKGNFIEELSTVDGKIYINNLPEGTYKLLSTDNHELNFEILSDNISSNIRINNKVNINRTVEAIATVILTLQTGQNKLLFLLFLLVIIFTILSLIVIKKHKRI